MSVGPLTTTAELPESMLLGSTAQAATWLAYVGLRGRYAARSRQQWMRWNGCDWERCDAASVHRAVRHALGSVYDEHTRLMDLNWRLGPLMSELRRVTLRPCVVKGCPWRGSDPHACPMHTDDEAWDSVHGYARYRGERDMSRRSPR